MSTHYVPGTLLNTLYTLLISSLSNPLRDYPNGKAKKTEAEGGMGVGVVKYLANVAGELSGRAVNGTQSGGVFTP